MFVIPVEGNEFSQRYTVLASFGERQFKLVLSWSPSRAGDERIPWDKLDGKTIDPRKHPLLGLRTNKPVFTTKPFLLAATSLARKSRFDHK